MCLSVPIESILKFLYISAFVPGCHKHSKVADLFWFLVLGSAEGLLTHLLYHILFDHHWGIADDTWSWASISGPATSAAFGYWDASLDPRWHSASPEPNRKGFLCSSLGAGEFLAPSPTFPHNTLVLTLTSCLPRTSFSFFRLGCLFQSQQFPRLPGNVPSLLGPRVSINNPSSVVDSS